MELTEHTFEELSALKYHIYTTTLPNLPKIDVLIVSFGGEYGYGSKGNGDATYINAIITAAECSWESNCFVLDYRNMKYDWGDKLPVATRHELLNDEELRILRVFNAMPKQEATLISKRNKKGIHSLTTPSQKDWLFDSLEDAFAAFENAWHEFQLRVSDLE